MREKVLHYIWQNRLFSELTLSGEPLMVVDTGRYNDGAGPDFGVSRIQMGDVVWVGTVELHLRSSDWRAHGHDRDPLYCSVVLHVVLEDDAEVYDAHGRRVPTAVLGVAPDVVERIEALDIEQRALRCSPEIALVAHDSWVEATDHLVARRIERRVARLAPSTDRDGTLAFFFRALMRYMGAHLNNDAMELTALSIPYTALRKHATDHRAVEAILMGQAGLIACTPRDDYEAELQGEYRFYKSKFGLHTVDGLTFSKLRVRPTSFPTRQLAIVAAIIADEEQLLHHISLQEWQAVTKLLSVPPSDYWISHYDFGHLSPRQLHGAGPHTVRSVMINAVHPTAYMLAQQSGNASAIDGIISHLSSMPPEQNSVVRLFEQGGIQPTNARDAQCATELYESYCLQYRCLACPVAPLIFRQLRPDDHDTR